MAAGLGRPPLAEELVRGAVEEARLRQAIGELPEDRRDGLPF